MSAKPVSYRRTKTVTRSISFDSDVFDALETRRLELRMDRSEFLRAILEDRLGIFPHPELNMVVPGKKKA